MIILLLSVSLLKSKLILLKLSTDLMQNGVMFIPIYYSVKLSLVCSIKKSKKITHLFKSYTFYEEEIGYVNNQVEKPTELMIANQMEKLNSGINTLLFWTIISLSLVHIIMIRRSCK